VTWDDPAVRELLATSFVARVATRSPAGTPALTPLWFVADGGHLYAMTGQATLSARNARARPAIAVLLDGEGAGPRSRLLRLRGRATVHGELPSWRVLARFAVKYYLGGLASELRHAAKWRLRQLYYSQGALAVLDFVPESAEWIGQPSREESG
jgi:hypothetical protein